MEPTDDRKLSELLKEWELPGAPRSLDRRVLGPRQNRWIQFLTGTVPVPVPVMAAIAAILALMAVVLIRRQSAPSSPLPAPSFNLADFRPVQDLNIRIIHNNQRGQHAGN